MTPFRGNVDRRGFVGTLLGASLTTLLPWQPTRGSRGAPAQRPNIVLIMTDDLGYGDLGFTGRREYATPTIDAFARSGMHLRHAYSAAPVCTPTRVALMTGRYPARHALGLLEPLTTQPTGLRPEPSTLARVMRDAGYETALVGKWHLGVTPEFHPLRHGFDEFYGFLGAAADHVSHVDTEWERRLFQDGETPVETKGYLTDLFAARAVRIIARERPVDRPLFLNLQFNAPHWPWQAPGDPATPDSLRSARGGSAETYARMMTNLDAGVGAVLDAIRTRGIERDTLVIFTSDNGGERFSHMGPFSRGKMTLGEGGIRVATFARWPGVIAAGSRSEQVAVTMDWLPTFAGLAGAAPTLPTDGIDLLPALRGGHEVERRLCWRVHQRRRQRAIREGNWKLLLDETGEHLFDVVTDPGEQHDRLADEPARATALRRGLAAWEAEMLPPVSLDAASR